MGMSTREVCKILLVHPDSAMRDGLVLAAQGRVPATFTCAATGAEALEFNRIEAHHVLVAGLDLGDMSGLDLAQWAFSSRRRPFILIGDAPRSGDLIRAIRQGAVDFLPVPVDGRRYVESLAATIRRESARWRRARRVQRDREVIRRVLQDRQQLNQRIELICRDMVGAHRRLFHRVLEYQQTIRRG